MYAANALADRIIQRACKEETADVSVRGDDEIPLGFFAHHDTVFRSCSSDIDGLLSLELARYLRFMKSRVKGDVWFKVETRRFWDEHHCYMRVRCFEVYATKEEAAERQREIIQRYALPWHMLKTHPQKPEFFLVS